MNEWKATKVHVHAQPERTYWSLTPQLEKKKYISSVYSINIKFSVETICNRPEAKVTHHMPVMWVTHSPIYSRTPMPILTCIFMITSSRDHSLLANKQSYTVNNQHLMNDTLTAALTTHITLKDGTKTLPEGSITCWQCNQQWYSFFWVRTCLHGMWNSVNGYINITLATSIQGMFQCTMAIATKCHKMQVACPLYAPSVSHDCTCEKGCRELVSHLHREQCRYSSSG